MAALTLQIDANRQARWSIGDQQVGDSFAITEAQAEAVDDVGRRFQALFEQEIGPFAGPDELRAMGRTLFDAWFAPAWPALTKAAPDSRELILRSAIPALLDLPWELVELAPGLPIGCDAAWSFRRAPSPEAVADPRPGPLRVLFLAAAPLDRHQLDYEREEDLMLRASADVKGEIVAHFAESGGIDELADLVAECRPHVVHLSGHGDVIDGKGVFAFEDERGRAELRPADEIAARIFRGKGVRLAFVNGCKTSQAAVAGLCRERVAAGVPTALGWAASVLDDRATAFAAEFYRQLVRGVPTPAAAAHARDALRRKGQRGQFQDATFALPQLYGTDSAAPFDLKEREDYDGPKTVYALLGDGIKGLHSGYVGRRREVQRLVPPLRQGEVTFAVLTGIGGTGKSTLATRAANRLQAVGYGVVPVKVEAGRDVVRRLIDALDEAFLAAGRKDLHALLTDGEIPAGRRLKLAVRGLNELKLVLVLDNLEDALDLETRRIVDPDLAGFLETLATNLVRGSRAIVTCRYLPEGTPVDLPNVLHLPLPEFPGHDALKFLRRDDVVDRRTGRGELTGDLIDRLYRTLGGTPGLLGQVRTLLRKADPDDLLEELEGGDPGMIAREREAYLAKILTNRLYDALAPEAQTVTRRLALGTLPLPIDAAATLASLTDAEVVGPLEQGVAYGLLQRFDDPDHPPLYHPPGLLRAWLTAPGRLAEDEARAVHAHLAAFWRASFETDREAELRVAIVAELEACRVHAWQAEDMANHRWAIVSIARRLIDSSDWNEARSLLEEITEEDWNDDVLYNFAFIDSRQGNHAAAREKFETAMQIRQERGDRAGEARIWNELAMIHMREGDYAEAREKFNNALQIERNIGYRVGQAKTLHNLAMIDMHQRQYKLARENFETAIQIFQALGDRVGEATTRHNLAEIDLEEGNYAAAREKFEAAMLTRCEIGDRAGAAETLNNLATIDVNQHKPEEARRKFDAANKIFHSIGDRAGEAGTWHNLASMEMEIGDYQSAREKFETTMQIRRDIGDLAGGASTFFQFGWLAHKMGRSHHATRMFTVCCLIKLSIGHGDAEDDLKHLSAFCSDLGYEQPKFDAMLAEVAAEYQKDGGWGLIERAFADTEPDEPGG